MALTRFPALAVLAGALVVATQAPIASAASRTLIIGVDHVDTDHSDPGQSKALFEYTDFFSREVRIRKGETLDFRTTPGSFHVVAVARNEQAARATYPVALLDTDDPVATGSQHKKIELGPSNGPIQMGNTATGGGQIGGPNDMPKCGLVQSGQQACTFTGGNDLESQGGVAGFGPTGPAAVDWQIVINADPGTYSYFCFVHPGMRGKVTVVRGDDARDAEGAEGVTTQAQIDRASAAQFREDREDAREAEREAKEVRFSGGAPGTRTYDVSVGISASNNHVAIDEMLPQHLNLDQGDRVVYHWRDPHNIHTVGFPTGSTALPGPFGPEFEPPSEPFELVGDPGNAAPGTVLTTPGAVVDAGLFLGTGYNVHSTVQEWSLRTNGSTQVAAFGYQCTVHDFMQGILNVSK